MVQGSLNPNITNLGEKLWPEAWNQKFTSYIRKKSKNAYKKRKNENFEKQKNEFLSHVPPDRKLSNVLQHQILNDMMSNAPPSALKIPFLPTHSNL